MGILLSRPGSRPALGGVVVLMIAAMIGGYFIFAAVQGDYGVFRQVQIRADTEQLAVERNRLRAALIDVRNRTRRMSDEYLDIDLLDEQARDVLGYIRADEIVIR